MPGSPNATSAPSASRESTTRWPPMRVLVVATDMSLSRRTGRISSGPDPLLLRLAALDRLPVQIVRVRLLEVLLDLLGGRGEHGVVLPDLRGTSQPVEPAPALRLPEIRANKRLGAVEKCLFYLDADRKPRRAAFLDLVARENLGIPRERGAAVDTQCLVETGDQEEQPG